MTKAKVVDDFKRLYVNLWINRVDYWTAHLAWTEYIDALNRSGHITDKQFASWTTPFTYGKRLRPTRQMLERKVYGF